jgi:DNA-binding response OmpR family regulator
MTAKNEKSSNPGSMLRDSRILIVEDSHILAFDMSCMLQALGVRVVGPTPSTLGGFSLLKEMNARGECLDAAVLDVHLGVGDGVYPLAAELRRRRIPLIFLTGYSATAIPQAWRETPRVEKPIDETGLVAALDALLAGSIAVQAADAGSFSQRVVPASTSPKPSNLILSAREAVRHSRNIRMEVTALQRQSREILALGSAVTTRARPAKN